MSRMSKLSTTWNGLERLPEYASHFVADGRHRWRRAIAAPRSFRIVKHDFNRQRNLRLGAIDFFAERAIVLQIGSPYFKGTTCFWM